MLGRGAFKQIGHQGPRRHRAPRLGRSGPGAPQITLLSLDFQKASGAATSVWAPRYGPLYPPLDYQHNVYIPGTPTMVGNKEGPLFLDQEDKSSFSTFGKRKKMSTYCEIHDNVMINNDLK